MNNQNLTAFKSTPGRIRTLNLLIRSQTLYPVELRAQLSDFSIKKVKQIKVFSQLSLLKSHI